MKPLSAWFSGNYDLLAPEASGPAAEGRLFIALTGPQVILEQGCLHIHLRNPAHSGTIITLIRISGELVGASSIEIFTETRFSDLGCQLSIHNFNSDCADDSVLVSLLTPDPDPATDPGREVLISHQYVNGSFDYPLSYPIKPGSGLGIHITNATDLPNLLELNAVYCEGGA